MGSASREDRHHGFSSALVLGIGRVRVVRVLAQRRESIAEQYVRLVEWWFDRSRGRQPQKMSVGSASTTSIRSPRYGVGRASGNKCQPWSRSRQ